MKLNQNIKIVGDKVVLIPYEAKHVQKYHEWMKNPELQELTASEPLSIEEEYKMEKTWRNDDDKCTFLVLSKNSYDLTGNEIDALVGDTNLFINVEEDGCKVAEVEIMIAEQSQRGQGLGQEATLLIMKYGIEELNIAKYYAKISDNNVKSINMFQKMQFYEISRSKIFREITFERNVLNWVDWLNDQVALRMETYK